MDPGLARGLIGGVLAGLAWGLLAAIAGGAVGPGRMQDVSPFALAALLHAVVSFGLGAVAGSVLATWWQRRRA